MVGSLQPAFKALGCMPNSALPRCVLLVPSAWFPAWCRLLILVFRAVAVKLVGHIPRISAATGSQLPRMVLARVKALQLLGVKSALVNDCRPVMLALSCCTQIAMGRRLEPSIHMASCAAARVASAQVCA